MFLLTARGTPTLFQGEKRVEVKGEAPPGQAGGHGLRVLAQKFQIKHGWLLVVSVGLACTRPAFLASSRDGDGREARLGGQGRTASDEEPGQGGGGFGELPILATHPGRVIGDRRQKIR